MPWMIALIICLYFAAVYGVHLVYWHIYGTMMGIWGVTSQNVAHAPNAVRFLYSWSNGIVQLLQHGALMLSALAAAKLVRPEKNPELSRSIKGAGMGAAAGGVMILLIWGTLMLMRSVRLGWRLSRPAFSVNTFALLITSLAASVAESTFFYSVVRRAMKKRLPIGAAHGAVVLLNVTAMMLSGAFRPVTLLNCALSALICCLLAERFGESAAAGFRFAWVYLTQGVFGFAGASAALYETYPVNLYWLNGGNAGLMNGVITTIALLVFAFLLLPDNGILKAAFRKEKSKSSS